MFLSIVLLVCALRGSEAVRVFEVFWTHSKCTVQNTDYVKSFVCLLVQQAGRNKNYVDAKLRFNRTISKMNINIRASVPRPLSDDNFYFDFTIDGCDLNKVLLKNSALKAVLKRLAQVGNSLFRCPMRANFTYSVERFSLNPEHFPSYAPNMNFTIKMQFITEKSIEILAAEAGVALMGKQRNKNI